MTEPEEPDEALEAMTITEPVFIFDAGQVTDAAALIDRLGADVGSPGEIVEAAHSDTAFASLPDHIQAALTTAFGYELDDLAGGRVRLTPETERDGFWMVRPYSQTAPEIRAFWNDVLAAVGTPVARAQLNDLILSTRVDSSAAHAERTVASYLEVASLPATDSLYAAMSIRRAAEIARTRGAANLDRIWDAGTLLLRRQLETSTAPGAPARLVDMLTDPPKSVSIAVARRDALMELLDTAETRYTHADAADWIADARRRLARTNEERLAATEAQVTRYLSVAASSEGMLKMHWAARAAEIARTHGATAAYERAVRMMQSIPPDAMNWEKAEFTATVPTVVIRAHIRRVAKADGWRQALSGFLATPSPSGSYEGNRETALAAARGSIRALFSTTIFGRHGMPEQSDADFEESEIRRTEQISVGLRGILLNEELREIWRRFGPIATADVAALMTERYGCDPELAVEFARALELFWAEQYSESARLLIQLIEAGARGLLLKLDEAIYRIARGQSPGRFPALDFYIDKLSELGLDPDWERALRVVLLFPGNNTRNMAAHGFKFTFGAGETAVLLRLAGLFCAMPVIKDGDQGRMALARPLSGARRHLRRRLGWVWR